MIKQTTERSRKAIDEVTPSDPNGAVESVPSRPSIQQPRERLRIVHVHLIIRTASSRFLSLYSPKRQRFFLVDSPKSNSLQLTPSGPSHRHSHCHALRLLSSNPSQQFENPGSRLQPPRTNPVMNPSAVSPPSLCTYWERG